MDYKRKLYQELSHVVNGRLNSEKGGEWFTKQTVSINRLIADFFPRGSGFDSGPAPAVTIDLDDSHADKLVFYTSFHHMDDNGYYCGWTVHTITVTPAFIGDFHIRVSGRNYRDIKDYIAECFEMALHQTIDWNPETSEWILCREQN